MHDLLPKMLALVLVAGGFAATGDLAWVTGLGMRLVNARTVPSEEQPSATVPLPPGNASIVPADLAPASGTGRLPAAAPAASPAPPVAPSPPTLPNPGAGPRRTTVSAPTRPVGGPDVLALDTLAPGDRLIVWLAAPTTSSSQPWIAFDFIDPVRLEAITQGAFGSPRRVRLRVIGGRGSAAPLAKGLSLHATPIGIAHPSTPDEQSGNAIGPVTAFTVTQPE